MVDIQNAASSAGSATRSRYTREYGLVLLTAGVLYTLTSAVSVQWQDTALLAYRILHNDLEGNLGLAVAHPLHIMVGMALKQIPYGDLARKMNLAVAIFGAVAVANVYLLLRLWLGRALPSAVAAMTLMLSWTFWLHATIGEVYPLYAAIMTTELVVLLRYMQTSRIGWLYLLAFLNGLSIADHMTGIIPLACYMVFIAALLWRRTIRVGHVATMAALWVIGALPYEVLIVKGIIQTGDAAHVIGGAIWGLNWEKNVLNASFTSRMAVENVGFILLNFPTPNIIFLFTGIYAVWRLAPTKSFAGIFYGIMLLLFIFAFRYTVPDRHAFFLPFYLTACVCVGLGVHVFTLRHSAKTVAVAIMAMALLPVPAYCVTPTIARHAYKTLAERRQVPYRDDYTYWLQPWHAGYNGGERFAREALGQVERNAFIYADSTTAHALLYTQESRGLRPDVKVASDYDSGRGVPKLTEETIGALMQESAVYVVSAQAGYCPKFVLDRYDTVREGVLYRVLRRHGS
jgi:hypothetical protein